MMNDFTKEELEELRVSNNIAGSYSGWKPERINLLNKLNAMIDNYCEHEFHVSGCGENMFGQCFKCGHLTRLEKKF